MKRSIMCVVALMLTLCILIPANIITADAKSPFYSSATTLIIKKHIEQDAGLSNYVTAQGSCTDGKYAYFAINNGSTTILKYNVNSWKLKSKRSGLSLGHANDMTYNEKRDIIVVSNNAPDYNILTFVDPDTLKIVGTKKIKYKIYSISYNSARDQYVVGISGTYDFAILDKDFKKVKKYEGYNSGYLRQGADCDDDYLYFVQSGGGGNLLVIYNWNGKLVDTVTIDKALEIENIFHVDDTIYITLHHFGNFVHRIGISDETAIKFDVSFDSNGGYGVIDDITVIYGQEEAFPQCNFYKEGYSFAGWVVKRDSSKEYYGKRNPYAKSEWLRKKDIYEYTLFKDEQKVSKLTKVGDVTATAFWIAKEYRIYYDSSGGEGHMPLKTVGYDEKFTLDKNQFTKGGYVFAGWTAQREYDGKIYGYAKDESSPKWLHEKDVDSKYIFTQEQEISKLTYDLGVTFYAHWLTAFCYSDSGKTLDRYLGSDEEVVFPKTQKKLETIADEAFKECTTVQTITIPESVQTVGKDAFSGCSSLSEIHFEDRLPQNVDPTSFNSPQSKKFFLNKDDKELFLGWYTGSYSYAMFLSECNEIFV